MRRFYVLLGGYFFMGIFEIIMIGVGLSMDAFAAAICKGLNMRRLSGKNMLIIGIFFGGFQAGMPLLGWALGKNFESYITSVDHWIAFALLGFIGGKMLWDVIKGDDDIGCCGCPYSAIYVTVMMFP